MLLLKRHQKFSIATLLWLCQATRRKHAPTTSLRSYVHKKKHFHWKRQLWRSDAFAVHLPHSRFLWHIILEKSLVAVSHWLKNWKVLYLNIFLHLCLNFILEVLHFPYVAKKGSSIAQHSSFQTPTKTTTSGPFEQKRWKDSKKELKPPHPMGSKQPVISM